MKIANPLPSHSLQKPAPLNAKSPVNLRGSGFRVLSCRAEGPVRVPVTGAVRRIARDGRRAAPSARARRSPADEPGHAARPLARHRVFVTSRAARRGAARASTTIHETHAYASPTQRKPSALRCRGRFVAFLWDGSGNEQPRLGGPLALVGQGWKAVRGEARGRRASGRRRGRRRPTSRGHGWGRRRRSCPSRPSAGRPHRCCRPERRDRRARR